MLISLLEWGTILMFNGASAIEVAFTPPSVPTRYRFVNTSSSGTPGGPISIASTLGTETFPRVVVDDTLYADYYPAIGFIIEPGQANLLARNYSAIAYPAASVISTNEVIHSFFIPKGSIRAGDRLRWRYSSLRSAAAETWTLSLRLHTSVTASAGSVLAGGISLSTGNLGHSAEKTWRADSLTTIISTSMLFQLGGTGQQGTALSSFTVPDMLANDLYVSVVLNRSGTAETGTIQQCDFEVLR
jgi:hypothetical protein